MTEFIIPIYNAYLHFLLSLSLSLFLFLSPPLSHSDTIISVYKVPTLNWTEMYEKGSRLRLDE